MPLGSFKVVSVKFSKSCAISFNFYSTYAIDKECFFAIAFIKPYPE
jgi:hypothetical protein